MATTKTTKKPVKKTKVTKENTASESEVDLFDESIDLSESLVKEIDNLMKSSLAAAQIGKVLGDIVSSFSDRVQELKQRKT